MAVPTFSPIADAEIEPGDTALSSVFVRLRDNPLAVLGVDATDPTPDVNPPRNFSEDDSFYGDGVEMVSVTATQLSWSAWFDLCDDAVPGQLAILQLSEVPFDSSSSFSLALNDNLPGTVFSGGLSNYASLTLPTGMGIVSYQIYISPEYTAGVFSGVKVSVAENNPFTQTTIAGTMTFGGSLLAGGPVIAAPSSTESLLSVTHVSASVTLKLKHQTVGTVQQIAIGLDHVASSSEANCTAFLFGNKYSAKLKG